MAGNSYSLLILNNLPLRLITCSALPCIWIGSHTTSLEIFDPENRKTVIIVKDFMWPTCNLFLIVFVYYVRHWTNLHLVIGALGLLGLPCFLILPESPRWLANNGKKEESEKILMKIASKI